MRRNKPSQPRSIEMTTGSLWRNILLFSLPLMLTQVLEVLFNLSDVAIAGKFAGYVALGAVGLGRRCSSRSSRTADQHGARA